MKKFRLLTVLLSFILMCVLANDAFSTALKDLKVKSSQATWSPISGTAIGAGDDTPYAVSLPFAFSMDNVNFASGSTLWVSCNCYVCFGTQNGSYTSGPTAFTNTISLLNWDMYQWGNMTQTTQGSSPNRVWIIQWNYVGWCCSDYGTYGQLQLKLYETSNKIETVYNIGSLYASGSSCYGFISGSVQPHYINLQPTSATAVTAYYGEVNPQASANFTLAVRQSFMPNGRTFTFAKNDPTLVSTWPSPGDLLRKGIVYGGSGDAIHHPAVFLKRESGASNVQFKYRIYAGGSGQVIYQATDGTQYGYVVTPVPQPSGATGDDIVRYDFVTGTGVCFGTGGTLDLNDVAPPNNKFEAGEYYVDASMITAGLGEFTLAPQKFNIALDYDLALQMIFNPKPATSKKYAYGYSIPLEIYVVNLGLSDVTRFDCDFTIYQNGVQVGPTHIFQWNVDGLATDAPLHSGQSTRVSFGNFMPSGIGDYTCVASCSLYVNTDQQPKNNRIPESGISSYVFSVAKEVDLRAVQVVQPASSSSIYVYRPMRPVTRYVNKGVNDVSEDSVFTTIVENATGDTVYNNVVVNYIVTAGAIFDTTDIPASKDFTPQKIGSYTIYSRIKSIEDDNPYSMKLTTSTFQVVAGLTGTYTIGTSESGSRNYTTIQSAVDAMYSMGVSDDVFFELTDRVYNIGNLNDLINPALDLTTCITGMGPGATVTFRPSSVRSYERADLNSGVTININSGSGIGIRIGQALDPKNIFAIFSTAPPSMQNKYSKSNGYFIFDGLQNKSIRFVVNTPSGVYEQTAFYFTAGAANNTIQNCIFQNNLAEGLVPHTKLPKVKFATPNFTWESEKATPGTSMSAAIFMRAIPPMDKNSFNPNNVDTLVIKDNLITSNEISGFGYGVVSLGQGVLLQQSTSKFVKFYNTNNTISNNKIYNMSRAGVFMGYEKASTIAHNRIYNITGLGANTSSQAQPDAAGIILGGDWLAGGYNGYNVIGMVVDGNEISGVASPYAEYGIKVEQSRNNFNNSMFPDEPEASIIKNNIIWGMSTASTDPHRAGIVLMTQRNNPASEPFTAKDATYLTNYDMVVSNTIVIDDDAGATTGMVAGIGVLQAKNTIIVNNAIAVLDVNIDPTSKLSACIFYEGIKPGLTGGLLSNRNAFYKVPKAENDLTGPAFYGLFEININGKFIEPQTAGAYSPNGYETFRQWRSWTAQDFNSIEANWLPTYSQTGNLPYLYRPSSSTPKGSPLNNRGYILAEESFGAGLALDHDIDGKLRGEAGQHYDIGASEFEGKMYISDVEFMNISEPASYRAGSGMFSDAEYVMTQMPIKCKVILRNSGNIFQSSVKVRIEVFMENNLGVFTTIPVRRDTLTTSIVAAQDNEIVFNIPDAIIKTYSDLKNLTPAYTIPPQFDSTMIANVTPRFRYDIIVGADENNVNNYGSVTTRYYIKKSNTLNMLISGVNTNSNIRGYVTPTTDQIAGRLNFEALVNGFQKPNGGVGYFPSRYRDMIYIDKSKPDSLKVDIFDRNSWEPKAVNYALYKYIFWSDADDITTITRYQRWDIDKYLGAGVSNNKKNLIIGSQEMVRKLDLATNDPLYDAESALFSKTTLRANNRGTGFAFGSGVNCNQDTAVGISIGRTLNELVRETGFSYINGPVNIPDLFPQCALMTPNSSGDGLARGAYYFKQNQLPRPQRAISDSLLGVATTSMTKNLILLGVDWRHWATVESILRVVLDFYDKNGGTSVPVELLGFNADAVGNRVELNWTTASELNTDRFEIERADAGSRNFAKISDVKATGKSNIEVNYGPVLDINVEMGNTYIYRLKMVDADGSFSFSDEKVVEIGKDGSTFLGVPIPNPAFNTVKFSASISNDNDVVLYDMSGRKLSAKYDYSNGTIELNVTGLANGVYTIVVRSGEVVLTRQFRVVK